MSSTEFLPDPDSGSGPDSDPDRTKSIFRSRDLPPDSNEPEGVVGRFELLHKLGQGAFSRVYKARDHSNGDIVALKILRTSITHMAEVLERLQREFQATIALEHPNIIRAMEIGQDGFRHSWLHFLVMEYIDGWDLATALKMRTRIPYDDACTIIRGVGSAVQYAHDRAFIHRDIKPNNIILPRIGIAKLADFGLVKHLASDSTLTRTGDTMGTLPFMPPEQHRDSKAVTQACDTYALAMTFLVMISGGYPFKGSKDDWQAEKTAGLDLPPEKYPGLSSHQLSVLQKAVSPSPADRHATTQSFIDELLA